MNNRRELMDSLEGRIMGGELHKGGYIHVPQEEAEEILALLKEQEPVKPDIDSEGTCTCGNCGETVGYYPVGCNTPEKLCKFCPECGRKVKWDD